MNTTTQTDPLPVFWVPVGRRIGAYATTMIVFIDLAIIIIWTEWLFATLPHSPPLMTSGKLLILAIPLVMIVSTINSFLLALAIEYMISVMMGRLRIQIAADQASHDVQLIRDTLERVANHSDTTARETTHDHRQS